MLSGNRQPIIRLSILFAIITIFFLSISLNNSVIVGTDLASAQKETKVSIVSGASTMGDKAFSPNPVNIKVGDTVTWTNDDSQPHTVLSGSGSSDPNMGKGF